MPVAASSWGFSSAPDTLSFRYSHLTVDGQTANGHYTSTITELPDGRLECHESWQWESRPGTGNSTIRECPST